MGTAAAISGDGTTIVTSAAELKIGDTDGQGEAYVFTRPAGGWRSVTESAQLTASDGNYFDELGSSVAISADGKTVVAGAPYAGITSEEEGAAYSFRRPADGWHTMTETAKLSAADRRPDDHLGAGVAVSGDGRTIVAGAPYVRLGSNSNAGAAYVFAMPSTGNRNLSIVKTAQAVNNGPRLIYWFTIKNQGSQTSQNLTVSDPLPQAVQYLYPVPMSGMTYLCTYTAATRTAICTLPSLPMVGISKIGIVVNVTDRSRPFTNCATIRSTTADTDWSNSRSCVTLNGDLVPVPPARP